MITFFISFILVFTSSYLLTSLLEKSNVSKGILYIFLIASSQIILISEILSCFELIKVAPFLICNFLIFAGIFFVWYKKGKPLLKLNFNEFFNKLINSLKLDKSLIVLFLGWTFFIIISAILVIIIPTTSADAYCYHVLRSFDWVINGSMKHYETADIRCLIFPINSEILYMWIALFTKKQLFLGAFSFVGYIMSLISGFQIFKHIGFSLRRTLWTYFMISSFASVIVILTGTETDLIVAGLISTSIYLFIDAVKNKNDISLFMSSLAYALAIGVKTPAIVCIPAVGILYLTLVKKYNSKISIPKFLLFGLINFMIFTSYNYILNFIHYGNIMGDAGAIIAHKNIWGFKGFLAGFIKHIFLMIDFSGIKIPPSIGDSLIFFENEMLSTFHLNDIPNGLYSGSFYFNFSLIEPGMGCGILSVLLILPCWIIAMVMPLFKKNRIYQTQATYSYVYLINIMALSATVAFMTFNTRFMTSFIIISAPMLAYSYIRSNKNILKWIYILIALLYMIVISTHLWGRPFFMLIKSMSETGIKQLRSDIMCFQYDKRVPYFDEWCNINGLLDSRFRDKNYKVLFLPNYSEEILYTKIRQLQGKNYHFINFEHLKNINPDEFDIIIYPKGGQWITAFDKYTPDKLNYVFYYDKNTRDIIYYPIDYNAEIMCHYNGLRDTISKQMKNENSTPIKMVCQPTINFFAKHPFKFAYQTEKHYILMNKKLYNLYFPD